MKIELRPNIKTDVSRDLFRGRIRCFRLLHLLKSDIVEPYGVPMLAA